MINVIVIRDGLVDENILCKDEDEAKDVFTRFDDMLDKTSPDIDEIFEQGFVRVSGGCICVSIPETVGSLSDVFEAIEVNTSFRDEPY